MHDDTHYYDVFLSSKLLALNNARYNNDDDKAWQMTEFFFQYTIQYVIILSERGMMAWSLDWLLKV